MGLDGAAFADGVDFFVGLALHVHSLGGDLEESGEVVADFFFERADFGAFEDDGGVEVADGVAGGVDAADGLDDEVGGVLPFVARVGVGEELADVLLGEGAEEGVDDGVIEDVAIAVSNGPDRAGEALAPGAFGGVGEFDAADDHGATLAERRVWLEAVEVVAVADAKGEGRHWGRVANGRGADAVKGGPSRAVACRYTEGDHLGANDLWMDAD